MTTVLYFDGETRSQYTSTRAFSLTYKDADGVDQTKMVAELNLPEGVTDAAVEAGVRGLRSVLDKMGPRSVALYAKVTLGWSPGGG